MAEIGSFERELATALKFAEDLRDTGKLLQGGEDHPNAWGAIECSHRLSISLARVPSGIPGPLLEAAGELAGMLEDVCDNDFVLERQECADAVCADELDRVIASVFSAMPPVWDPRRRRHP